MNANVEYLLFRLKKFTKLQFKNCNYVAKYKESVDKKQRFVDLTKKILFYIYKRGELIRMTRVAKKLKHFLDKNRTFRV